MKVAIVYESSARYGGAERVVMEMVRIFPDADLYSLEGKTLPFASAKVRASFLRRLPPPLRRRRWFLPLYPLAPETFDLSGYDVVISSSSAFAKGVVTRPSTLHVCYCHAPTRFLWDWYHPLLEEFLLGTITRGVFQATTHFLRVWDRAAARRVDVFIANSEITRQRIRKFYGRDATVIYPPVSIGHPERSEGSTSESSSRAPKGRSNPRTYFLFVGRLSPYKRADLVVQTFNKLELPLVVAGRGRMLRALRRMARSLVEFQPHVSDAELPSLYAGARAVIFPSDDDFGMVPVEAMASGTPVLALRKGGATETVIEGVTGEFFDEPMEELLADCVRRFLENEHTYDPQALRARAACFSPDRFRSQIRDFIDRAWTRWRSGAPHSADIDLVEANAEQGIVSPISRHGQRVRLP